MNRSLLLLTLLCLSAPVQAAVYTYIDADGNRVFTDQPGKGAKRVELSPGSRVANTPPAPASKPKPQPPAVVPRTPPVSYQMLRILVPLPDAAVREENGSLIVTVTSEPALQAGHRYRLLLDGQPATEPSRSPVFTLTDLDRGTHRLSAEIIDHDGYVIERTAAQPFHLQRISLIQKRRQHPCKTADYGVRPECPLRDKPEEKSSILPFL